MNFPNGFSEKTIDLEGRTFFLQILKFENGCFVSVSEGTPKLGSMVVSLTTNKNPVTTTVIPSKSESLFLKLISERVSSKLNGIAVVSTFVQKELSPMTTKDLLTEIIEIIEN